jgi:hypothetical protein
MEHDEAPATAHGSSLGSDVEEADRAPDPLRAPGAFCLKCEVTETKGLWRCFIAVPAVPMMAISSTALAAICDVIPPTILAWVARGRVPHFKTRGGQVRFRVAAIVPWLRENGYTVPLWLAAVEAEERRRAVVGT